ncbi:MAG: ParA family protein [Oleibacter sp.]|nr:ParA family protein [Thalassolituus sp.]
MKIWSISNQKGGVGKTTSVVSLAGLLADQGYRVLLVDLDPHGSLSSYFGYDTEPLNGSVYQLFFEHRDRDLDYIHGMIQPTSLAAVQLLPSSTLLATLERKISTQDGMGLVLARTLAQLRDEYDYVLLDTPPILGVLLVNALAACERLIIPTQTEFLAIKGLERMIASLQMVMKSQRRLLPYTILPTMFDRRTNASLSSLREMQRRYSASLSEHAIPVDTRLRDASRQGVFPHQLDSLGRGVRAYRQLLRQLQSLSEESTQHGSRSVVS